MKKLYRKIAVWCMLIALLVPYVGNIGVVFGEEQITKQAANTYGYENVLRLTAEMVTDDKKITVTDEVLDCIVVDKALQDTSIVLQNVFAREVIVEGGKKNSLEILSGNISKITVQESTQENNLKNIILKEQADVNTILVSDNANLDLTDGVVKNVVIFSENADKVTNIEITGYNGDMSIQQAGATVPTNGNRLLLNLKDSKIKNLKMLTVRAITCIDAEASSIEMLEAEGRNGVLAFAVNIDKLVVDENSDNMDISIYSKVTSLTAKGDSNYIWLANDGRVENAALGKNTTMKEKISVSPWFNATHTDFVVTPDEPEEEEPEVEDVPVAQRVSREELVYALLEACGVEAVTDGVYSYDDFADAQNKGLIEAAIRAGYITVEADLDNMVLFNPKGEATREFAARTISRVLGINVVETCELNFEDAADVTYVNEVAYAIDFEIFELFNNCFLPDRTMTKAELNTAVTVANAQMTSTDIEDGMEPVVNATYVEEITAVEAVYYVDENAQMLSIPAAQQRTVTPEYIVGGIYILQNGNESIAIRVEEVSVDEGGNTYIKYEIPAFNEVVSSLEVVGSAVESNAAAATFTPAANVMGDVATFNLRRTVADEVPLWGVHELSVEVQGVEVLVTLDLKEIEYRFDVQSSLINPIDIREIYIALNSEIGAEIELASLGEGFHETIDLGDFNVPVGYGINLSGEIAIVLDAEAGISTEVKINNKTGVQYRRGGWITPVFEITPSFDAFALKGEAKVGLQIEPAAEFLGMDIVAAGMEVGLGAEATPSYGSINTICMDVATFVYMTLYAKFGPDILGLNEMLEVNYEVMNADNSIWTKSWHLENLVSVPECTFATGQFEGIVKNAANNTPIQGAKVQVIKDGYVLTTQFTGNDGKFTGTGIPAGSYILRVAAPGFIPYEQPFDIIGGSITSLPAQLMIEREGITDGGSGGEETVTYICAGEIRDSLTGELLAGVEVSIASTDLFGNNEVLATAITDASGAYAFEVERGNYVVTTKFEGYVANRKDVVVVADVTDVNITINPENTDLEIGSANLRIVLQWGESPRDLDSHFVGSDEYGDFHVAYYDKDTPNAWLDVDDVSSYGPETITMTRTATDGAITATGSAIVPASTIYSYYVHDYTNGHSNNSTEMSESGAWVEIYSGAIKLYTINVPSDREGTVWHVFDYDYVTGTITLKNDFYYGYVPDFGMDFESNVYRLRHRK